MANEPTTHDLQAARYTEAWSSSSDLEAMDCEIELLTAKLHAAEQELALARESISAVEH